MSQLTHGSRIGRMSLTVITWLIGLFFFFPIFWMTLISFRNENEAATFPPTIIAKETLANYKDVFSRGIWSYLLHSGVASIGSTLIVIAIGYPAAYALSIKPIYRSKDVLGFLLSTKFLPPIAALLPLYLILKHLHLMDNLIALMILYVAMNLPLAVWMLRSFLKDIPKEIVEAAELDGAGLRKIIIRVLLPISSPGIAATALICFIFTWNEFLLAVNLTATRSGTGPVYLMTFITSEGLFFAHLAAVSVVVSLPVILAGWVAQDKLVRGLSLGAVK